MAFAKEREVAAAIAEEAGALLLSHFHDGVTAEWKAHNDPVTAADHAAEALIRRRLANAFPDDLVVGEEGTSAAEAEVSGARRWYVDPLDGTTNFLKRQRRWAVSLGFVDADGHLSAAAVRVPCADETYTAARGNGATLGGVPLAATDLASLEQALVAVGNLVRGPRDREAVQALSEHVLSLRVTGSTVCDLVDVAAGRADAFVATGCGRWDLAAGGLLAAEAGARVTTVTGAPADRPVESMLAATPALHPRLLRLLA